MSLDKKARNTFFPLRPASIIMSVILFFYKAVFESAFDGRINQIVVIVVL